MYQTKLALMHNIFFNPSQQKINLIKSKLKTSTTPLTFSELPSERSVFYFLRKEKIYTKLKYSRCPQYDIVSGGIAALFSAFLGFLICEKFGLELLDSGDFYFVFMYAVFATFLLRPFVKILNITKNAYSILSMKYLYSFYRVLLFTFLKSSFLKVKWVLFWFIRKLQLYAYLMKTNQFITPTIR